MIEGLIELFVETIGEAVIQLLFEMIAELGITSIKHASKTSLSTSGPLTITESEPTNSILAAIGSIMLGALFGGISVVVLPHRILSPPKIHGLSMLLSPLLSGLVMHGYGRWRDSQNRGHSRLATFAGGALFAFALAATRYLLLRAGA